VDEYVIDTRTAGSITLLIQSLLPVVALSRFRARSVRLVLRGGTTVSHSPAIDYWTHVASPVLQRRLGLRLSTSIVRRGYYPKGGGEVRLEVEPSELRPFQMMECGKPVRAAVYISGAITPSSSAHTLLRDLSELIPPALNCAFGNTCSCTLDASQVTFDRMGGAYGGRGIRSRGGPSAVIHALLVVETDTGCIYGADRLIEGQSMQETDAREVTAALVGSIEAYLRSGATCDEHMADQLVVWMALLSGCSAVSTGRRLCTALVPPRALMTSQHLETAVLIARQVLGDIMQSPSGGDGAGSTGSLGGIDLTLSEPTPSGPMLLSCSC
jgi:RNA 3'-terminal phosphate cyclase (ATP)